MPLLPVDDALARILDAVQPTAAEQVPIEQAHRRVLAIDHPARLTQPPFDASAMDGYALRAADAAVAGTRLEVVGTVPAGHPMETAVAAGQSARIFTGAPLPAGTDTVLIQENAVRDGEGAILVDEPPSPGANVRLRGIDFTAGASALPAGRTLDAHALSLAAAMGYGVVTVRRRPRVAILATGDELVPPGLEPGPGAIVSSNPVGIAALVEAAGGEPVILGIARDRLDHVEEMLAQAGDPDVLVTVGGASVGDHDLIAAALTRRGMQLAFWKVAIRPGKPLIFGRLGATRVLGLPGNPVSALICAHVFLIPLIRALLAAEPDAALVTEARVTHALEPNGPRLHLVRARVTPSRSATDLEVTAERSQDSSLLSALARANCVIVRAPNEPAIPRDALVRIRTFSYV